MRRVELYAHEANWPGFTPPRWPVFTPPLTMGLNEPDRDAEASARADCVPRRLPFTGLMVTFVVDHFVRPKLIGGATKLPFLWVLLAFLAALKVSSFSDCSSVRPLWQR
jgi:hypothetical protein